MSHLTAFRQSMIQKDFDAAIISCEVSQRYLSGFAYSDGYLLITKEKNYLLTDFRYEEAAKKEADSAFEIVCPTCGMPLAMAGYLADEGAVKVAVEEKTLSLDTIERFKIAMPEVTLASGASAILDELRICKDSAELDTIARAQKITDDAFAHILKVLTPNMTEVEVALELEFFMRRNGAEDISFETIAVSGSASALPHGVPRRQKLEKGFLTMDFGARVDGYCADMTRTVVLGRADEEMKKLYNTVLSAQLAALDAAREGFSCRELDKIARDIIDNNGYKGRFGHSLGHGVGMYVHEGPNLSQSPRTAPGTVLCRGNVVTFEPGIYISGKYGCRIEDMVAIDLDGSVRNFTASPKDLIELF